MRQLQEEREGRGLIEDAQAELVKTRTILGTLAKRLGDKGGSSLDDKAFVDVALQTVIKVMAVLQYYGATENINWIVDKRTKRNGG